MRLHKSGPGVGCLILLLANAVVFPQAGSAYSTVRRLPAFSRVLVISPNAINIAIIQL